MRVYREMNLSDFKAWGDAIEVRDRIINEGKADAFEQFIEEEYPEGIDEGNLNDLLRFETDWLYKMLGIIDEE